MPGKQTRKGQRPEDACRTCGAPRNAHQPPCRLCRRSPEHHEPSDLDDEWAARARMATTKRDAGHPLDALDAEALKRHPNPSFLHADPPGYRPRTPNADETH